MKVNTNNTHWKSARWMKLKNSHAWEVF